MKSLFAICIFLGVALMGNAQPSGHKRSFADIAKAVKQNEGKALDVKKSKIDYKELIKDAQIHNGLFRVLQKEAKVYFEIPDSMLNRDMLLSSRIINISNNKDLAAGQMPRDPLLIQFSRDQERIYLHQVNSGNVCAPGENIEISLHRNNLDPVMEAFDIVSFSPDSASVVVDVTKLFCSDVKALSPFREASVFDMLFGGSPMSGNFQATRSSILTVKTFEKNINIHSRLVYEVKNVPFTADMARNIILLPKEPMKPRLADDRIGFFADRKMIYSSNKDRVEKVGYINRWRLEPKPEDLEKYKNGELVVPKKQIVYYVDNAFPEQWKKYIKKGIEDWQKAFEAIGFKNAIVARDYPLNDPTFDPDDIRFSCFRYITTSVENSMGPSWTDPRSGEIIQGDVLFYHNVVKLLHDWRFVQTAAVDPSARKDLFDEDTMGEALRYVAAHEVGHTLGLMHNMGASSAFPVDSLRSASFTQKYGTTPSIMDYARNNYVAQPGDKGVRLVPPLLGVYDYYAIKWGYKPIWDAKTPEDEYTALNQWILEKAGDRMYHYGAQQIFDKEDPSAQSEDLGDDAIKASRYGIANTKIILKNLSSWATINNRDYSQMRELYKELMNQYARYISHVQTNLGGIYLFDPVKGDHQKAFRFVPKEKQKEALRFLMSELSSFPGWVENSNVLDYLSPEESDVANFLNTKVESLLSTSILARLATFEKRDAREAYTQLEYMDDLFDLIWAPTMKNKGLSYYERNMQSSYVKGLLKLGDYISAKSSTKIVIGFNSDNDLGCPMPSADMLLDQAKQQNIFTENKDADAKVNLRPIVQAKLKQVKSLLEKTLIRTTDRATRYHYQHICDSIQKALK